MTKLIERKESVEDIYTNFLESSIDIKGVIVDAIHKWLERTDNSTITLPTMKIETTFLNDKIFKIIESEICLHRKQIHKTIKNQNFCIVQTIKKEYLQVFIFRTDLRIFQLIEINYNVFINNALNKIIQYSVTKDRTLLGPACNYFANKLYTKNNKSINKIIEDYKFIESDTLFQII